MDIATVQEISSGSYAASVTYLVAAGYAAPGDAGGQILFKRSATQPSHPGYRIDQNGVFWELAERIVTPQMLGVKAGSTADQSAGMQAWLDVLGGLGVKGYVPRGNYKMNAGVTSAASGLVVSCHEQAVFDLAGAPNGSTGFTFAGSISTYSSITVGSAQEGATQIRTTVSRATSLAVGDEIRLRDDTIYDKANTGSYQGEINIVAGLSNAASGYVDLLFPLQGSYTATPRLAKVSPLTSLEWTGGRGVGSASEENNQTFMHLMLCADARIEDAGGRFFDSRVFAVQDTIRFQITRPDCREAHPTTTGYGVSVIDCSQDGLITDGTFVRTRHSLSTNNTSTNGGLPRRILFARNTVQGTVFARGGSQGPGDAVDTHGAAEDIWIEDNTVLGSLGQGINFECRRGRILRNTVIGSGSNGIAVHNESDFDGDIEISGNDVRRSGGRGIYVYAGTRSRIVDGTTYSVNSLYQRVVCGGNRVDGAAQSAIQIGASSGRAIYNLNFSGNNARGNAASYTVFFNSVRSGTIGFGNLQGSDGATNVVRATGCANLSCSGGVVTQADGGSAAAIYFNAPGAGISRNITVDAVHTPPVSSSYAGADVQFDNFQTNCAVYDSNVVGSGGIALGTGAGNTQANNKT